MDKREFRNEARNLGKVVSSLEEVKDKKKPFSTYTIKVSDIISNVNNVLKLGRQTTVKTYMSNLQDILKSWGKKD